MPIHRTPIIILDDAGFDMNRVTPRRESDTTACGVVYFPNDTILHTFFTTIEPQKRKLHYCDDLILNQCAHHIPSKELGVDDQSTVIISDARIVPWMLPPEGLQVMLHRMDTNTTQEVMVYKETTIKMSLSTYDKNLIFDYYIKHWHLNCATYQEFNMQ